MHAGLPALGVGGEKIGFGEAAGIDALGGLHLMHGAHPVAQSRRLLEIQRLGSRFHILDKAFLDRAAFAGEKKFGFVNQRAISRFIDPPDAGR